MADLGAVGKTVFSVAAYMRLPVWAATNAKATTTPVENNGVSMRYCSQLRGAVPMLNGGMSLMSEAALAKLSGAVTTNGVPEPNCKVYAYRRVTGEFIAKTFTDAAGNFSFPALFDASVSEFFVVAVDPDTGVTYNALIFDRLLPVNIAPTAASVYPDRTFMFFTSDPPLVGINTLRPPVGAIGFSGYAPTISTSSNVVVVPTGMLTVSTPDPYYSGVVIDMSMDGANNSAAFTEAHGLGVIVTGNAVMSTARQKFGPSSARFAAQGDYIQINDADTNFGTGDFTVEEWVYIDSTIVQPIYQSSLSIGTYPNGLLIRHNTISYLGSTVFSGLITAWDGWHFITVSRVSGTLYSSIDGVVTNNGGGYTFDFSTRYPVYIGVAIYSPADRLAGYIDSVRITKGVGRYTSNFSVPQQAPTIYNPPTVYNTGVPKLTAPTGSLINSSIAPTAVKTIGVIVPSSGIATVTGIAPTRAP